MTTLAITLTVAFVNFEVNRRDVNKQQKTKGFTIALNLALPMGRKYTHGEYTSSLRVRLRI
jgi:1,4-dihydroxy-2-naphthoate octaprenyltransferase